MGFSRQEYWSGLPFPSPGDLPDPGIKPRYPALQAEALPSNPLGVHPSPWQFLITEYIIVIHGIGEPLIYGEMYKITPLLTI